MNERVAAHARERVLRRAVWRDVNTSDPSDDAAITQPFRHFGFRTADRRFPPKMSLNSCG
jgi:hypothetical protein